MNRWKLAVPVLAALTSLSAVGCYAEVEARSPDQPREVVVQYAPPAAPAEAEPAPVDTTRVWVRGHWHWTGADWQWRRGHWETRRTGLVWVPSHYQQRGRHFIYVEGHWRRQ